MIARTPRQREILDMLRDGIPPRRIAARLGESRRYVNNQVFAMRQGASRYPRNPVARLRRAFGPSRNPLSLDADHEGALPLHRRVPSDEDVFESLQRERLYAIVGHLDAADVEEMSETELARLRARLAAEGLAPGEVGEP